MPSVSVVIATYNTATYVGAAVCSVLNQSAGELEVIVVDDGSTDETAAVLSEFAGEPRVRCIRQENQGQAKAKNRGIRESSSPIGRSNCRGWKEVKATGEGVTGNGSLQL